MTAPGLLLTHLDCLKKMQLLKLLSQKFKPVFIPPEAGPQHPHVFGKGKVATEFKGTLVAIFKHHLGQHGLSVAQG